MAMDRCLVVINLAMVVINQECLASLCQACNQACHLCSPGCHHKIYNPNWTSAPWCGVLWRLQPLSKDSHWFWWWVTGRQFCLDFFCATLMCWILFCFSPILKKVDHCSIIVKNLETLKPGFRSMIYWVWGKKTSNSAGNLQHWYGWRIVKNLPSIVLSTLENWWIAATTVYHCRMRIPVYIVSLGITELIWLFSISSTLFSWTLRNVRKNSIECAISMFPGNGWLQEMGSNEEQPMRRFAVWIGKTLRGAVSSVVSLTNLEASQFGKVSKSIPTFCIAPAENGDLHIFCGFFCFKVCFCCEYWLNFINFWKGTWCLPSWD